MQPYPDLKPADIVGVRRKDFIGKLMKRAIYPPTQLFHFFLIGDYLPWDDDYVILESIGKGIAVGRLSFYDPADLAIFRRVLPDGWIPYDDGTDIEKMVPHQFIRKKAAAELTRVGRARYDWLLVIQTAFAALGLLLRGKFPPWHPEQFPYGWDKDYICTEAVVAAWRAVGFPVVPEHIMPLPAAIKRGIFDGTLQHIYPVPAGD